MLLPFTLVKFFSDKKKESKIILFEGGVNAYTFLRLLYIYYYMCVCLRKVKQVATMISLLGDHDEKTMLLNIFIIYAVIYSL